MAIDWKVARGMARQFDDRITRDAPHLADELGHSVTALRIALKRGADPEQAVASTRAGVAAALAPNACALSVRPAGPRAILVTALAPAHLQVLSRDGAPIEDRKGPVQTVQQHLISLEAAHVRHRSWKGSISFARHVIERLVLRRGDPTHSVAAQVNPLLDRLTLACQAWLHAAEARQLPRAHDDMGVPLFGSIALGMIAPSWRIGGLRPALEIAYAADGSVAKRALPVSGSTYAVLLRTYLDPDMLDDGQRAATLALEPWFAGNEDHLLANAADLAPWPGATPSEAARAAGADLGRLVRASEFDANFRHWTERMPA